MIRILNTILTLVILLEAIVAFVKVQKGNNPNKIIGKGPVVFLLLAAVFVLFSCRQRTTKVEHIAIPEVIPDTLTFFPELPEAPLITFSETIRWNPASTGYTKGWEERMKNCYADSLQEQLKTMFADRPLEVSETALPLRNDIQPQRAPVLLVVQGPEYAKKSNKYWSGHSIDSIAIKAIFQSQLTSRFDCRFGPNSEYEIIKASYPIEIKDTTAFRPVIIMPDPIDGKIYSPLFECFYRGKSLLICSFDLDSLKMTSAGRYFWDIVRNYTYTNSFRNELCDHVNKTNDAIWYDTMAPGHLNPPI